jgi:type I restriction enzyme S subunit
VIRYLDTSSITRNQIGNIQVLDSKIAPFPSRAQRKVKSNTIIYSTVRPEQEHFGIIEKENEDLIVSSGFMTIDVTDKEIDPKYLYYLITRKDITNYLQRVATNNVSAYPSINPDDLGTMEFVIPSDLSTQQKIAAVLSALDAKIELNQRINAELESMAKTLYDYWFVQFDFPNEKGKPYKSAGGKMVWNEELGKEIPQGWDVKPLGKALKTNLGGTPSTKNAEYWENATIPWLNSGDLSNFPIISSSSFVTRKGIENSATTILPKGSVVISLVRYIRPSIIALEACANQSVVGILETDKLKNTFIYPYLVNEVPRLMALRTGAQQPHINKETIDETLLCIPPANILGQYYKISEPIYKKIINLAFESQTLTELRGWLLPLLMNGQVKV